MGIDVSATDLAGLGRAFEGTAAAWIKCHRCSVRLQRPYPVETMELEGGEASKLQGTRYRMVVVVECHGEKMRCALEVPVWWGEGMRLQALAYVYAFVPGPGGVYTCETRRGRRGQSAGALTHPKVT
jgi:hypothetical protein